jgi:hypothetical protein
MKKIFLLFSLTFSLAIQSQELVGSMPIKLNYKKGTMAKFRDSNNNLVFVLSDDKKATILKYSNQMALLDSISFARPDKSKYKEAVGYTQNDDIETIYWSYGNLKDVQAQIINFKTKSVENNFFGMEYPKEEHISEFSLGGNFYVVKVPKRSNKLKFYVFGKSNYVDEKIIDFGDLSFDLGTGTQVNFYTLITNDFYQPQLRIGGPIGYAYMVNRNNTNSLVSTFMKSKIYIDNNAFNITFDNNPAYTQKISIDLKDFNKDIKYFEQPLTDYNDPYYVDSNSFLHNNLIYQIKSTEDKLAISVKQLDGKEIKSFSVNVPQTITFKNTDLYKYLGDFGNIKTIDDTKSFLKKMKSEKCGIVVNAINNKFQITYGSVSQPMQSAASAIGGQFGAIGSIAASTIDMYSNSGKSIIDSYNGRLAYYTHLLTDAGVNQLPGSMQKLGAEKILEFSTQNSKINAMNINKWGNTYFLTVFNKDKLSFDFYKFEDEQ